MKSVEFNCKKALTKADEFICALVIICRRDRDLPADERLFEGLSACFRDHESPTEAMSVVLRHFDLTDEDYCKTGEIIRAAMVSSDPAAKMLELAGISMTEVGSDAI